MKSDRVKLIDSLRGGSLLGILLANLLIFQYGMFGKDYLEQLAVLDEGAYLFTKIAIEGSFMPIFTLLFGYSLIKFVESVKKKRFKSRWHLIRRSIGLLALGFIHGTFLWEGDILSIYGIMILCLLLFIHRKAKTLFIWSGVIFLLVTALSYGTVEETKEEKADTAAYIKQAQSVYSSGSYSEVKDFRNNVLPPGFDDPIFIFFLALFAPLVYAPMFLLGMGLAKIRAFQSFERERKWYVFGSIFVPIGLICKGLSFVETEWSGILLQGGATLLALGYVCLIACLFSLGYFPRVFKVFESVGRLSLTNYLMQTVICTTFYYGYGFGMFGELGVFNGLLFGLCLFGLQCLFSTLYLRKFKRGPIETLFRIWTNFSWNGYTKVKKEYSV